MARLGIALLNLLGRLPLPMLRALGAWIGGAVRWDWPLYYSIAAAMQRAARELNIPIVWGGVWDRRLNDLPDDMDAAVAAYVRRRKDAGRSAFIDGPHFELQRAAYP